MPTLVIRGVEPSLHARLKAEAAAHGRSMEEEARQVLRAALAPPVTQEIGFGDAMRALFEPLGGLDLPAIEREPVAEPPDFSGTDWATEQTE